MVIHSSDCELDPEWIELLLLAKSLGIKKEEIAHFLKVEGAKRVSMTNGKQTNAIKKP